MQYDKTPFVYSLKLGFGKNRYFYTELETKHENN